MVLNVYNEPFPLPYLVSPHRLLRPCGALSGQDKLKPNLIIISTKFTTFHPVDMIFTSYMFLITLRICSDAI